MSAKRVDIVQIKLVKERSVLYSSRTMHTPSDVQLLARQFLEDLDREAVVAIALNAKSEPTCLQIVSIGSINSSIVHPREVFKMAILSNAYSIILVHQHPTGNPSPSTEDDKITDRLVSAGKILGIPLLDHIVLGDDDTYYSFREAGKILEDK